MLVKRRVNSSKVTVVPNTLLYLFSPTAFVVFLVLTGFVALSFPYVLLVLLLLLVPKFRFYSYQIVENNLLLFAGVIGVAVARVSRFGANPKTENVYRVKCCPVRSDIMVCFAGCFAVVN